MSERERLELDRLRTLIRKQIAETKKLRVERDKLETEKRYYPAIVAATVAIALAALANLFF